MIKKKRTKTKDKLLSLSKAEADSIGRQVMVLIKNEMKYIVNKYIYKYRNSCAGTWGWTDDDLRQHITIILWKGVATFDPARKIKLTTYLSTLLYYQMGNLSKSLQNQKNSMSKLYCPEELYDSANTIDMNSAEDWCAYAQSFKILQDKMSKQEMKVLIAHLLEGLSLTQMEKKLKIRRPELVSIVKSLTHKMEYYMGVRDEKNSLH